MAMRVTVLGQALIGHDLRARVWPDLAALAALLGRADAVFTDLETAIATRLAEPPTRDGVFLHAAPPAVLDCLQRFSISLLAAANNHVWDLGTGGVLGMLDELDRRNFTHAGAGRDLAAASAPAYLPSANGTTALVAFASGAIRPGAAANPTRPGVNELRVGADGTPDPGDRARILAAIAAAARQADLVIAGHHNHLFEDGGRHPPLWLQDFARDCIAAGASVYAGHGAPRLHGIEIHRGLPIFYNLGSFIFQTATAPGHYNAEVWQSIAAECRFENGLFRDARLIPLQLNADGVGGSTDLETRGRPSLARDAAAAAILGRISELARRFGTTIECDGDTAVLSPL